MPQTSLLEDALTIGLARPKRGIALALFTALLLGGCQWVWPSALGPFGIVLIIFLWVLTAVGIIGAIGGYILQALRGRRLNGQREISDLHRLTAKQFEEVVADAYRRKGFRVLECGGTGDGGIDLIVTSPTGTRHPVQCKRWRSWTIGSPQIMSFIGAVAQDPEANSGIFVTCGTYTKPAIALARKNNIELIGGEELLTLIGNSVPRPEAAAQLTTTEPAPTCPACTAPMVLRTARQGSNAGTQCYGCSKYPKCKGTKHLNPSSRSSEFISN